MRSVSISWATEFGRSAGGSGPEAHNLWDPGSIPGAATTSSPLVSVSSLTDPRRNAGPSELREHQCYAEQCQLARCCKPSGGEEKVRTFANRRLRVRVPSRPPKNKRVGSSMVERRLYQSVKTSSRGPRLSDGSENTFSSIGMSIGFWNRRLRVQLP